MKYAIDIGHNCPNDNGQKGIRSEEELTYEVGMKVIEKLKKLGNTVIDCLPKGVSNIGESLCQRTAIANENKVDLFVSIHFNAGSGRGTEVYVNSSQARRVAQKILGNIVKLGFLNRGMREDGFYVLRKSEAPAILILCCFVDSKEDMERYDGEAMASAIVEGLVG